MSATGHILHVSKQGWHPIFKTNVLISDDVKGVHVISKGKLRQDGFTCQDIEDGDTSIFYLHGMEIFRAVRTYT